MIRLSKTITAIALLLPVSMATFAIGQESAPEPMKGMPMHKGMGMMDNMTEEQKEQHLQSMQEKMLQMHDLSNQILAEKDPAKKQQLKNQQLEMMKAHHAQMMQHRQNMRH